ncbi:MAG: tetratricopeptide repeat protein [Proteobacteria bacterium]|nr:tetratricopeptide repeat protein [Pseudomonadota bacterium]
MNTFFFRPRSEKNAVEFNVHVPDAFFIVVLFSVAACSGSTAEDGTADTSLGSPASQAEVKDRDHNSRAKEIEHIIKDVNKAKSDRDWIRTKQAIGRGLELIEKGGAGLELQQARLLLDLGNVEREEGQETEARRHYADAMAIFHVHKSDAGRFETYLAMGQIEERQGDYATAARLYTSAEALLPNVKDSILDGKLKLHTGRLARRQVRHEKAREDFIEAVKIFDTTGNKKLMAETLLLLAAEEDTLGHTRAYRGRLDKALSIFRDLGDMDGEVRALHRQAALAEREKKYKKAKQLLKKVYELYDKLDRTTAAITVKRHINALPETK